MIITFEFLQKLLFHTLNLLLEYDLTFATLRKVAYHLETSTTSNKRHGAYHYYEKKDDENNSSWICEAFYKSK